MKGYIGKILWMDCCTGKSSKEIIPEEVYKSLLGGIGLCRPGYCIIAFLLESIP